MSLFFLLSAVQWQDSSIDQTQSIANEVNDWREEQIEYSINPLVLYHDFQSIIMSNE